MQNKDFPIQGNMQRKEKPSTVPWWLAEEAYKEYSRLYGTAQTLQRLSERGGFCREEFLTFIRKER